MANISRREFLKVGGTGAATAGAAIATGSMVTEMVKGKTLNEALAVTNKRVAKALGGLPDVKMHCSNLGADALRKAIEDYRARQGSGDD